MIKVALVTDLTLKQLFPHMCTVVFVFCILFLFTGLYINIDVLICADRSRRMQ